MKTIDEIQTEFVTAFNEIDDWMMQYEFLRRWAQNWSPIRINGGMTII